MFTPTDQFVDIANRSQEAVTTAVRTWADTMQSFARKPTTGQSQLADLSSVVDQYFDFAEKGGRCNGLALDAKNSVLVIACGNNSMTAPPQGTPATPTMVIMSAKDGKSLTTLPIAAGSESRPHRVADAAQVGENGTRVIELVSQRHAKVAWR